MRNKFFSNILFDLEYIWIFCEGALVLKLFQINHNCEVFSSFKNIFIYIANCWIVKTLVLLNGCGYIYMSPFWETEFSYWPLAKRRKLPSFSISCNLRHFNWRATNFCSKKGVRRVQLKHSVLHMDISTFGGANILLFLKEKLFPMISWVFQLSISNLSKSSDFYFQKKCA